MRQHLLQPRLLDVEDLAAQGQDRLETPVAALLGGAAGRGPLDDVDLTVLRLAVGAIGQLAGEVGAVQQPLAHHQVARLAGGLASARRGDALLDDAAALGGVLFQVGAELLGHHRLHLAFDLRVAQAGLGLALKLRLRELHAHDGHQPFAHVLARQVGIVVLQHLLLAGVVVQGARERRAEAGEVAAAIDGVDAVGERERGLREAVVVLDGDLHRSTVHLPLDVDRPGVDHLAVVVQVTDEAGDAAIEEEVDLAVISLVDEMDPDALRQVGDFTEMLGQRLEIVVELRKDLAVGQETGDGAGLVGPLAVAVGIP